MHCHVVVLTVMVDVLVAIPGSVQKIVSVCALMVVVVVFIVVLVTAVEIL